MNYKPCLRIFLALTAVLFAQSSSAETIMAAVSFHPTTNCELLRDIMAANAAGNGPKVVDLGGQTFELSSDCATAAPLCPGLLASGCFANAANYSHGPTGLPEIRNTFKMVNGRIVRASDVAALPNFNQFRILTVTGGILSLFKITLENGSAQPKAAPGADAGNGGAAYVSNGTTLNIQSSKIAFNLAHDSGGGIYVAGGGTLDVQTSIVSHNRADAINPLNLKAGGGGIYLARTGELAASLGSLDNSTVSNNNTNGGLGGGLNNQGRAAQIFNSTFSYNNTCIPVSGSGECLPGANPAGAGGGIYNDITATLLEITQSTFWGNRSLVGGGIYNEEATVLVPALPPAPPFAKTSGVFINNNTIANNYAQLTGGGISNEGGIINQFVSNIVAENTDFSKTAPDIFNGGAGFIQTVVLPLDPPVLFQIVEGFNLVGDCGTTGQCGLTNDVNKDIIGGSANVSANIDPRLHELADNGGPTETIGLFPDSPAINNGYNNLRLVFDQRGPFYYRTVGQSDVGSYEVQYDLN